MAERKMKTKYGIESQCAYLRAILNGSHISRYFPESACVALRSAIEVLEWVLEPHPGKKRMKTRAQIEDRLAALRQTAATEPDEDKRRVPFFRMQALGWVLDPLVLSVLLCFNLTALMDGPRRLKAPVQHSC